MTPRNRAEKHNAAQEKTACAAGKDKQAQEGRKRGRKQLCVGREGDACRFRRDGSGKAAYTSTFSETQHCIFCDSKAMMKAQAGAPYAVQRILNSLKHKDNELHQAAVDRMKQALAAGKHPWEEALQRRECQQHTTAEEVIRGEAARAEDAARAAKNFPEVFGSEATTSWQSPLAQTFEKWALEESWRLCPGCDRLMPQRFLAGASGTDAICRTKQSTRCSRCASDGKTGYRIPTPEDVPELLRQVPHIVLEALRPFRISCGPGEKAPHGYWVHTAPIRFYWKEQCLEERIADVSQEEDRHRAEDVANWLMKNEQSSFKKFDALQRMFLAALEDDKDVSPRMPLAFMETVGIECAAWPHLYWETCMCETFVRSQDRRRLEKTGKPDEEEVDEGDDDPVICAERRQSAKASFFAKLMSRVIGYGTEYELVQFVYDLWMYSGIGGAKNAVKTELRAALAGKSFSPEFWKTKHAALQDLQAQLGTPTLFLTVAPYEWTAPYHRWILDEMSKTARSRTNLPAAESLHLAHILTEAVRGLLVGSYSDSCQDECLLSGCRKAVFFARLEFQDGKRQTLEQQMRTQFYHGRGTVHVHVLVWLQDADSKARLPEVVAATLPPANTPLGSLVRGSQLDRQDSSWPLRDEASEWDVQANTLKLQHPRDAFAAHCRAYMPDVMGALKCHMDVQAGDGRGHVLRYTAGYIPKFSAAWPTHTEDADAHDIGFRILSEYHPLEMEMMLQLGSHMFPQCFHTGSIRRVVIPVPWETSKMPAEIQRYMQCDWRAPSMSLLDYLRLSDRRGNIHSFVKKQYALEHRTTSLENFVNKCQPTGEVLVAAIRYSRGNPNFFKQWLMMHVPFRQIDDLWIQRAEVVPADLQGLALCLLHRPRFWRSMAAIRREMELEAYRDVAIETRLEEIRAATELIDSYFSGTRQVDMSFNATEEESTTDQIVMSAQQRTAVATILRDVKLAIDARTSAEDPDADEWKDYMAKKKGKKRSVACLGAAGTGKSVVAKAALREAMQNGAVAAVACPTGLQSAAYRCSFPDAHVETVHSFFGLHAQEELTLGLLSDYDLIVVEEVGQITCAHFERIWRLWEAVDRRPVLLFVGDFMQLPAIDDTSARDSPRWKEVLRWEFTTLLRSECAELSEKLALLRHQCPNEDQLRWILRGHRASIAGGTEPTVAEVATVLAKHPNATLVTYTRRAAAEMNRMAVTAFFQGVEPVAWIPADPDSNADNFRGQDCVSFAPNQIAIHIGMRLSLTRNINKGQDYVNGMSCIVEAVNQHSLEVQTASGRRLVISRITEDKTLHDNTVYRSTFFPVRLGYATTLHKVQGSTLEYMAVWLDKPNVRAAGYVALSRVRRDSNWCFFGQLTVEHFTPWRRRA